MQSRRYGKRSACALSLGAGTAPVLPKDTSLQSTRFFTPVVEKDVGCSSQKPSLPRAPLNREEASCFSGACLAQRLCPSPDRPMALTTAPNVRAAAAPQIPPIAMPRATSALHHSTATLTSTATTKNTTVDNITVPASLVRIFHPLVSAYAASAMLPTHHPHGAVI